MEDVIFLGNEEQKQAFVESLRTHDGNVTAACRAVRISRQTFYNWRKTDPTFDYETKNIREECLDQAEAELREISRDPSNPDRFKALRLYLEARGKMRGYGTSEIPAEDKDDDENKKNVIVTVQIAEKPEDIPDDYEC